MDSSERETQSGVSPYLIIAVVALVPVIGFFYGHDIKNFLIGVFR